VCEHFGILLYRIVAGRNCPIAASLSSQAYVPIPGLSEQANRTLALVIAKQIAVASCGQVLREILAAEGIAPRSPAHPSQGFTAAGTGSTVVPSATPPSSPRTSSATSTASSSRFRPMPVAPLATPAPPPSSTVPPPIVVAPPPLQREPVEAAGARLPVGQPPVVEPPPAPPQTITPAPPVKTPEPTAAPAIPPPPKISGKKSKLPAVAKAPPAETESKEEKASPEPAIKAEAVTVVERKIEKAVAPASSPPPPPPKLSTPPVLVVPTPASAQNVTPWIGRNIRPIGIGIAALLVASLAYGVTAIVRSRNAPKNVPSTAVTQQRHEPASKVAENPAPAPTVVAGPDAEQEKINAERLLAERTAQEQKAAEEKKLAEQKAADEKKLAEQTQNNQPDPSKLTPQTEAAAKTQTQDLAKNRNQKQTQKDPSSSSRNSASTRSTQTTTRPPAVAPVTRPPPAAPKQNSNPQRSRSEFGPTAPGG
jgi:hypothetical protein